LLDNQDSKHYANRTVPRSRAYHACNTWCKVLL